MMNLPHCFQTDEGTVKYGIVGQGKPLVLVHGTPWSSFTWHKLVAVLAKSFRVYYYDLIGYGQSEMRDDQKVSLDKQSEVFGHLLDHWELDNPIVIEHDFGGAITLRAHLLGGYDYSQYVLMNVVAMAPWGSPFFAHVREHESAFSDVPKYIHKAILQAYIRGAIYTDLSDENFAALLRPWLSDKGQAAFYRQIAQADQKYTDDVEPLYGDIRCPTQIFWGEQDEWIPLEIGQQLSETIPHAKFIQVPNAGHLVQLDQSDFVAKEILNFLG